MGVELFGHGINDLLINFSVPSPIEFGLALPDLLAQRVEDPDILGQIRDAFTNFVQSGQAWAFGFGLFFGYVFRTFTAY